MALATLPTTGLASRYAIEHSAGSNTTGTDSVPTTPVLRALSIPDQVGSIPMTGAATTGAKYLTDALGRKFLRFEGYEFMSLAIALSNRNASVWVVGRNHRSTTSANFLTLGGGTAASTLATSQALTTNASSFMRSDSIAATQADKVIGCQLQVMGFTSRTTALGGKRFNMNAFSAESGTQSSSAIAGSSCEVGRNAFTPGSAGTWGTFDLYELIVYSTGQTNSDADTTSAALTTFWNIPTVTNQLVVEGDSITQQVGNTPTQTPDGPYSGAGLGMLLTNPGGSNVMPSGWRVVNVGVSGNQTSNLLTRRDAANAWPNSKLPGRNVVICMIGRNNLGAGAQTGAATYAGITPLWNTATTGYLQRGWEGKQAVNICVSSSLNSENTNLRTLLRASQFLNDCLAGSGQSFDGKLGIIRCDDIRNPNDASDTIFDTVVDATDTTWMQGDSTHPNAAGNVELAKSYFQSFGFSSSNSGRSMLMGCG
jgi:lysophospholipase L1-like esterase